MQWRLAFHNKRKQKYGTLGGMLLRLLIQRLFVPTLILIIVSLFLAGVMGHRSLDAQQIELTRIVANTVDTFLQNAENMLRSFAKVADQSEPTQLAFYLKSSRRGFGYFDTIYRLDKHGIIVQLEPFEERYTGLDQSRRPFFVESKKRQGLYISRPFNSIRTGKPTVNMTLPLSDGGMMVAELNLGAFQDAVAAARHDQGKSAIIIVDQTGTFLAHPRNKFIVEQAQMDNLSILQDQKTRETTVYYRDENRWMFGSYTHVPSTGWVVLVQVPLSIAYGALFKVAVPVIVLCLFLWTMVALNFRKRFWKNVIAPLTDLSQTALAISSGDLARTAKVEKEDEIGVVAKAFNSMTAQLRDVIGRLEERVNQLTQARVELKKHQEKLAELVQVRTAALSERTQQLESQAIELSAAKQQAEFANAAKSEFLAHMSHEIRTPLNAVTGLTQIVLKSDLTDAQRDNLHKVQIASKNLLGVINDILDFSKVEAGRLELEHHPFSVNQVVEQLSDLFSDHLARKDLEIILDLNPNIPNGVVGDAGRLTQVLTNLVANAVKYTQQGEIVVSVELDNQFNAERGDIILKFKVSDTGTGIPATLLPKLFEPFTQAEDYLTRQHEGTGLGLSICRRLVELMGGRIWAESTPGHGSTFFFTVVMMATDKEPKTRLSLPANLHGLNAIVVDDSEAARHVTVTQLESLDFNVFAVDSRDKAIETLSTAAATNPFHLVLLDWKMPGMDSIETAQHIREMGFKEHEAFDPSDASTIHESCAPNQMPVPIIMVTAYGHKSIRTRIDASVVDTFLSKPVKKTELYNTIMALFNQETEKTSRLEKQNVDSNASFTGRRVLVVEDSDLNRDVTVALLEDAGITVETAENGKIAVNMVTMVAGQYYDAVLMDIQMPVMDGYEATRRIRQWESNVKRLHANIDESKPSSQAPLCRIPIIALTAHAMTGEKERCLSADMDDYISKPIDEKQLRRKLFMWVKP